MSAKKSDYKSDYPPYCFDPRTDNINKMFCYDALDIKDTVKNKEYNAVRRRARKCRNQFKGSV